MIRRHQHWLLGLACALGLPLTAHAQGTGTITGRVTATGGEQPLPSVQVGVIGGNQGAITNDQGVYTIRGVQAGTVRIRALRVGYTEATQSLTVAAGQTVTANLTMAAVTVQLTPVVTTATGQQRRVEVGNAIAQLDAAELVQTRPVANMSDLLAARAPGVQVLPGNATGTGARVRIRGTSSLSLSNEPIYVIDGVRMQSSTNSSSIGVGGSTPSRVGDINPEEIESLEVVRGPSAATLYGTDAANGVIVIRTKRGRAGPAQWNAYVEQGAITDRNDYPLAYTALRPGATQERIRNCTLFDLSRRACTQDSVSSYNLFADPEATPLGTGYRQQYGLNVGGGNESVRYYVAGEFEDEVGLLKIADFDVARLRREGIAIRDEWMRPNALNKITGRINLNAAVSPKLDLALNTSYIHLSQRLPQSDNNTTGLLSSAYGGPGLKYNVIAGDTLYGYRAFTPGDIFQETVTQDVDRFIGSLNTNWRPTSWLSTRGNFGVDFTDRVDSDICRRNTCSDFGTSRLGFKIDNRTNFYTYTVDGNATGTFQPRDWLNSQTTVGVQFIRDIFDRNGASGEQLPPGATQITAASVLEADEATSESRTLGAFVEQNLAFRERLYLTLGVRSDRNSAFGANFETVFYPKASVSYLISEEGFFPKASWVNQFRLRTAYGASGVQPGTIDAVQFLGGTTGRIEGAEVPGVVFSALGNPNLKPERSAELELGGDATLFNSRVNVEVTYYNKVSKDALIARQLPRSLGTGSTTRFENLGRIRNQGFEGLINAQLLQRPRFGWDVTLNGSTNRNEIEDLGELPTIVLGVTSRHVEGYPTFGYWTPPILGFSDANGDNIITGNEVMVGDTAEFLGYSIPRYELSFTNGFDFFNRRVRLTTLVDYKGGHKLSNGTDRIRCQNRGNCRGLLDPTAPLAEQARVAALVDHPSRTQAGFIEDASFIRFRELALTLNAPESFATRLFRGRSLSATLSARNLGVITDYTGIDPESNYGQNNLPSDFQTAPPPTYYTLRLNVGF